MTVILGHPARLTHATKATFVFYSNHWDVDSYRCSLDRKAYKTCVPMKTFSGLKTGKHHFAAKAVSNGVAGPAVRFSWTIKKAPKKVVAPTVLITSHPSQTTVSTSASFRFSSNKSKASFVCGVDVQASTSDSGWAPCTSPSAYTGLTPGMHAFTVVAVANQITSSPKAYFWSISGVAPKNTALPTITGTAQEGQKLSASSGSWTGTSPIAYSYQWQRCDIGTPFLVLKGIPATGPVSCGDIVGATEPDYTPESAQIVVRDSVHSFTSISLNYYTLRVVITATNAAGQSEAASAQTSLVLPAAPVNVDLPTISVDSPPVSGDVASAGDGDWLNYPYDWEYQWQRCDTSGASCSDITGATDWQYTLQDADIGSTLRVEVTVANGGGSASATSAPTEEVQAPV
ncbi:MAG: hypothetical protein WBQ14_10605 [Gaiellaceae bacterium]